jgi:hypothetical protein
VRVDALVAASNQRLAEPELEAALETEVVLLLLGLLLLLELAPACPHIAYAGMGSAKGNVRMFMPRRTCSPLHCTHG